MQRDTCTLSQSLSLIYDFYWNKAVKLLLQMFAGKGEIYSNILFLVISGTYSYCKS